MSAPQILREVESSYENLTEEELSNLGIVLGAYRSFRGDRRAHVAYVSMPITSGKRLYDVFSAENVRSVDELAKKCGKAALWEMVMQPNITEGISVADRLGKRENLLFIAPSVFEAKKWRWSQDAYMSLWYRVIGEMAGKHVVINGWEYSNGGVDEVLFSLFLQWRVLRRYNLEQGVEIFGLKNFLPGMSQTELVQELEAMWKMRIFDAEGIEIRLDSAFAKCVDAVSYLHERDLPYDTLLDKAFRIMKVPFFSPLMCKSDLVNSTISSDLYRNARNKLDTLVPKEC